MTDLIVEVNITISKAAHYDRVIVRADAVLYVLATLRCHYIEVQESSIEVNDGGEIIVAPSALETFKPVLQAYVQVMVAVMIIRLIIVMVLGLARSLQLLRV